MAVTTVTDAQAQEVLNAPKAALKFYADWCGTCKLLDGPFKRFAEDERFTGVQFFNINAEENEELRKRFGVSNLPFFATLENGEVKEAIATGKKDVVENMISKLV